jgi:hypothetical protein
MKARMRKFSQGGDEGLEDFENKAMPKRYSALDELASGKEKGSFDEDVYERARKFVNRGGASAAPAAKAKPAAKPAPAPSPAPAARAEIPKSTTATAPESTGEDTSGPSNMDRIFMGLGAGAGVLGAAKLARLNKAEKAAKAAKAAAAKFSSPQARQATSETGRKFGPKAEMEAAESTMRGAVSRKGIQAKRAAAERARGQAETMERNKPVMQATPKKSSPRDRTREDREPDYELRARGGSIKGYDNGGSVRGGGCERRGKTVGRFV